MEVLEFSVGKIEPLGQFHIGEHLMAKNNLQNSLKLLVLMYPIVLDE